MSILKKFITGVIVRLVLIFSMLLTLAYMLSLTSYVFSPIIIAILLIAVLVEFFKYITKTNRDLSKFIFAIKHQDFSVNFAGYQLGNAFDELHASFKEILEIYRQNKLEKEEQFQLIKSLFDKMPLGLMVTNEGDGILLMNPKAEETLQTPSVNSLSRLDSFRPGILTFLKSLDTISSVSFQIEESEIQVQLSEVHGTQNLKVYLFQNLGTTIENVEMDAWVKLIRILTHEIMNSITSISSLAATSIQINRNENLNEDLNQALESIHNRSQALIGFVDDYRKLTSIPAPRKSWFSLLSLSKQQCAAMQDKLNNVAIHFHGNEKLQVFADEAQIAQVLINLILNAAHAMKDTNNAQLNFTVKSESQNVILSITDNGRGISQDRIGQIFVPFYSTKPDGTGIGLSLSRQIMRHHRGSISVKSELEKGTSFSLRLPLSQH